MKLKKKTIHCRNTKSKAYTIKDPVRYVISTLVNGLGFQKSSDLMLENGIIPPSKNECYKIQHQILPKIEECARESCKNACNDLQYGDSLLIIHKDEEQEHEMIINDFYLPNDQECKFILLGTIHQAASGKYVTTQYLGYGVRARSEGIRKYRELNSDAPPHNVIVALYQNEKHGNAISPLLYKRDKELTSSQIKLRRLGRMREKKIEDTLNPANICEQETT